MLSLILTLALVGQTKPATAAAPAESAPTKQWFTLTNAPGWQGYGALNANGWVITEKFRKIGTTEEVQPATTTPGGFTSTTVDPAANTVTTTTTGTVATTTSTVPATYDDPYGFLSWLNATRAAYGLSAVGHDPNLSAWAAENNNHQAARGMGHFVMGPARRQNAAMGAYSSIGSMWMNSRGHRAALLDPTIRWIGIAGLGSYWTFNAY